MRQSRPKSACVITVLNLKGGVGKTHTAWLIAAVCQERGERLLVIDTDTQANLTRSLLPTHDGNPGVEALFDASAEADPATLIRPTRFSHIDVIPSSVALVPFDLSDQRTWERSDLHLCLVDAVEQIKPTYDYILFDCPPRLSLVTFAALCASEHVLIPLEAADWGAQGIVQVTEAIHYVQQGYNPQLTLLGYLVSRFKTARTYQKTYLATLKKHFGPLAFDTVIPDLARYEKSVTDGIPITLQSPASVEAGIARRLFAEIRRRIQGSRGRTGRKQKYATRSAAPV